MATTLAGKISSEDFSRLLLIESRHGALEKNPHVFSQAESIEVLRNYYDFIREVVERYEIDESREWSLSKYSGAITYEL